MRIISEQELKDILDKHGKWLRNEENGERANLSYADLSYANLSSADLSFANLSSADLSSADLSYANLSYANLRSANLSSANLSSANLSSANLMTFQLQRHQAFYTFDDNLRIGCLNFSLSEWINNFEDIGKQEKYSEQQIKAYGLFIKMCAEKQLTKTDEIVTNG